MGAKKKPFYRIVVTDSRVARGGRYLENLGTYDPLQDPPAITLDEQKVIHWLANGAQPSDTVRSLLTKREALQKYLPKN
jgi:small subunit ribosomal protein S16